MTLILILLPMFRVGIAKISTPLSYIRISILSNSFFYSNFAVKKKDWILLTRTLASEPL